MYELYPFPILTQSIERTFIDKIFALCDYHLASNYHRYSRHLYDIHKIWDISMLDMDTIMTIMPKVIQDRQQFEKRNQSCRLGAKPKQILIDIIKNDVYKNDYQSITSKLIYKDVQYRQCIESLKEIINANFIPEIIK